MLWLGLAHVTLLVAPHLRPALPSCHRVPVVSCTEAWRSSIARAASGAREGLELALESLAWPSDGDGPQLVLLTVPREHSSALNDLASHAARELSCKTLVATLSAGAIGGGKELDQEPAISLLAGNLPAETELTPFVVSGDRMPSWGDLLDSSSEDETRQRSFLIFADPFSPAVQVTSILNKMCPGSLIGLGLSGSNFEMHTATAQGAAPVGSVFQVTKAKGNLVQELDGRPAMLALQETAQEVASDERLFKLMQRALLVGTAVPPPSSDGSEGSSSSSSEGARPEVEPDFLIRQLLGVDNQGGLYVGDQVEAGVTYVQFHVRDEQAAHDEIRLLLSRYKLERSFTGRFPGDSSTPAACMLFSCNGRGMNMYQTPNHDSDTLAEILGQVPTGGFFCNGEVGPLGVKGLSKADAQTYLHGFTSVVALLYDKSRPS